MAENTSTIKLEESWKNALLEEFNKDYFIGLKQKLIEERQAGHKIYPPGEQIFAALNITPLEQVKVVILGQDPYHGAGQAHGLCFSVNDHIPFPPSLQNIFKELQNDLGVSIPKSGNLSKWAKQGVLLLNASLTVRANSPNSHSTWGWQTFTDRIIQLVNERREHIVFLLWGAYAQSKEGMIDPLKHLILKAPHPSPFSAARGFMGCKHFSKANAYLIQHGIEAIDWQL